MRVLKVVLENEGELQLDRSCEGISITQNQGRKEGRKGGREEGREEGRKGGREEGRKEGRNEGRKEGRKEGTKERTNEGRNILITKEGSLDGSYLAYELSLKQVIEEKIE